MARLPRLSIPDIPQHIIQRGNNRQVCFASEDDFTAYAHWLEESAKKYQVKVHAWVFMTNHVHLLVTPSCETGVSNMMQTLGRKYVRYFNSIYKRTGTLWEGRFKSCLIEEDNYLLLCQRYIELNPVRANMIEHPADYRWSSFHANGYGQKAKLWTAHPLYLQLGKSVIERTKAYRELFVGHLDKSIINEIRDVSNQGMVLGSEQFKKQIEMLSGRRTSILKRGPKPKTEVLV
ncbi:MAG: transposase [Gammaproteobacteria bacterium]|nr:transposase [Gammaproteobacteria bacterium]